MIQLVYTSAATDPFTRDALRDLLAKARLRNATYGVTGMLLYHTGSFMQVLEGPDARVDLIFASISRDPRHKNARVLHRNTLSHREFEDWSMGFVDTSNWPQQTAGLVNFNRPIPQLALAPTAARRYLRLFQEGLCRQAVA